MRSIIGQYIPVNSLIHRIDPRIKVVAVVLYIVFAFLIRSAIGYAVLTLFLLGCIWLSKINISYMIKALRPIVAILIFTLVINLFFTSTGSTIFEWWIIRITDRGIIMSVKITYRLVLLIMGSSILTLTTTTVDLTDAMERLMRPLNIIKFPVHELSMMMTIALRFIPTLMEETDRIMKAQKARGANFEEGNAISRAKALIPVLVPLFVSAFRIATDLATAMESRCYHGGEGRTRMKILKMHTSDYISTGLITLLTAFVILDAVGVFYWSNEWIVSLLGWSL